MRRAGPVGRGSIAMEDGQAAAVVRRTGLPSNVDTAVGGSGFRQVIPVLSGSPGTERGAHRGVNISAPSSSHSVY
ncbi:MAG TPA: hypothetical protein VF003_00735 [Pseudonocardiaceae bacterium]